MAAPQDAKAEPPAADAPELTSRKRPREPQQPRSGSGLEAPVRPEYTCRVVKDPETGKLRAPALDDRHHHTDDIIARWKELPTALCLDAEPVFQARQDHQQNFLSRELQQALRKRTCDFDRTKSALAAITDGREPRAPRRLDIRGKLYLAPLTTVGNLPFRRLCKRMGADVTCGEMALAQNLLQGQNSEWALLRRHKEEDVFGVQIAGGSTEILARAAEIIGRHCEVDFIDINCGCPIDLLCQKGSGCALMTRPNKLVQIAETVTRVSDTPVSVKMRIGKSEANPNAHEIIGNLKNAGLSWVAVHGRSKAQRYSRTADWNYMKTCDAAAHAIGLPFVGNGDVYNWEDAYRGSEFKALSTVMVARGALIKPWIFTEIKEKRHWDISAEERFDLYKSFVSMGLEHWGADDKGVHRTRQFFLDWLSFLYRYVPLGLLEHYPITMNHRSPPLVGRSHLETLLASHDAADWIKITEIFLGPAPEGYKFSPRHKSNAWG